jgi:hypothetical protein
MAEVNKQEENKPGKTEDQEKRREMRAAASTAFLALLIGLAYQEGVAPARESIKAQGLTLITACLFLSFFFLGLTTFLSGYTHLLVTPFRGEAWLLNFCMLAGEGVILIFMAGLVSAEASQGSQAVGFLDYLFIFYVVDVSWFFITTFQGLALLAQASSHSPHPIQSALRQYYEAVKKTWWVNCFAIFVPAAYCIFLWFESNEPYHYRLPSQSLVVLSMLIFIGFVTTAIGLNRFFYDFEQ